MKNIRIVLKVFYVLLLLNITFAQPKVVGVESVGIAVSDLDVILPFYTNVLHFELLCDDTVNCAEFGELLDVQSAIVRIAKLKLGKEKIELIDFISPEGKPYLKDSHSNDLWFQHIAIITSNMDSAYAWLKLNDVKNISVEPQRLPDWNKNAGGIKAYYFQDPDGHPLEILEFPSDKGNLKWHKNSGNLFLGIDHTAIAVASTEESLKFYRNVLGMKVSGESENYGIEQSRLNNVVDAHLRITGLHSESGFGIEFLDYLTPNTGRNYPDEVSANDLIHLQTILSTDNIDELIESIVENGYQTYTEVIIFKENSPLGFRKGFIVKDPNGHRLLIIPK